MINVNHVSEFLIGGYGAFDRLAVTAVRSVKPKYPNIRLYLVVAYLSTLERDREYIEGTYDQTIYPPGLELVPKRLAIIKRNEWMVSQSDYILAYTYRGGGAAQAVDYARRKRVPVTNLVGPVCSQIAYDGRNS